MGFGMSWKRFWKGVRDLAGGLNARLFSDRRIRREMSEIRRLLRRVGFVDYDLLGSGPAVSCDCESLFAGGDGGILLTVGDRWDEEGRISLTMLTESRRLSSVSDGFLRFSHFANGLNRDPEEVRKSLLAMVSEALEDDCRHGVRRELEAMRIRLERIR